MTATATLPFAFGFGPQELLIIMGIVLLLFGAQKLPGLARSLGRSVTEFKKGVKGDDDNGALPSGSEPPKQIPNEQKSEETPAAKD